MNMFGYEKKTLLFPAILLAAICLATYAPLLGNPFLLDDVNFFKFQDAGQIFQNPGLLFPETSHHIEPFYNLTNAIFFSLFHDAGPLYLVNIVLFFLNSFLFVALILFYTKDYALAVLTGVLFAIHPMSGEVMMHISFNNILFCTALMQLSLLALYKYLQSHQLRFYMISLGLFLLALPFQEISVLFPLYAASFLFYKTSDIAKTLRMVLPFAVFSCLWILLWLIRIEQKAQILNNVFTSTPSFWTIPANFFILIKWYVSNLLFPQDIVFMYNTPPVQTLVWVWATMFALLMIALPLLNFIYNKKSILGLALSLWIGGFLFLFAAALSRPHMGFVVEPYWFYFPSVGFFIILALLIQRIKAHTHKHIFFLFLGAVCFFLFSYTQRQISLGKSQATYCMNWLEKSPNNTIALEGIERLIALDPSIPIPESLLPQMPHLVDWYLKKDKNRQAARLIKRLLKDKPALANDPSFSYKLAVASYKNGDIDQAETIIDAVLRQDRAAYPLAQLAQTFDSYGLHAQAAQILNHFATSPAAD